MPRHLLTTDEAEILKKVVLHSVATAFASIVYNNQTKCLEVIKLFKINKKIKIKCYIHNH